MRCNNCGFENSAGESVCVKCGYPLGGSERTPRPTVVRSSGFGEPAPRPTVVNAAGSMLSGSGPRPTVVNAVEGGFNESSPRPTVVGPMNGVMAREQQVGGKNCPHCGYLVIGNFKNCPNCGGSMDGKAEEEAPNDNNPDSNDAIDYKMPDIDDHVICDNCGASVSMEYSFCPKCGQKIVLKTISVRPRRVVEPPKPKCSLTLIPDDDEQIKPLQNNYEGESVMLTRSNTEPKNRTITSKEQAELTCEDGRWYIENHSELKSTMLQCNRKIEILPGDVIVLGDRRFKFEMEEQLPEQQ